MQKYYIKKKFIVTLMYESLHIKLNSNTVNLKADTEHIDDCYNNDTQIQSSLQHT